MLIPPPRSILSAGVLAGALLAAAPGSTSAQTCLGPPAREGEVAFVGDRGSRGVTTSYGGRFQANLGGTVALGAGFSVDTFEDLSQNGFTSRLSVGMPRRVWKIAACPVLGVGYSEVTPRSGDGDLLDPMNSVTLAPGIGFGVDLPLAGGVSVGGHARPALLFVFGDHARARGGRGQAEPSGPVQGGVKLGAVLRLDRIFVGAETFQTTLRGEPAVFFHVGIVR